MTTTTAVAPKANGAAGGDVAVAGGAVQQATAAPLTASEESWAILDEVYNKLQPFVEQCTGTYKGRL
jgi:hypothetical protein